MDFIELKSKYRKDHEYSDRTYEIEMLRKVLEGKIYDVLRHSFHKNYNQDTPISLSERRPSVKARLCKVVVDNSVSLLFGEGRFPIIDINDEESQLLINSMVESSDMQTVMIEVATSGSVGSGAIFFKLIEGVPFFEVINTEYLTPHFNPLNPRKLLKIVEKYKEKGSELKLTGEYQNLDDNKIYWVMREWTQQEEIHYIPWLANKEKSKKDKSPDAVRDENKTVQHDLGFVPLVWIKNLPCGANKIDGYCTFIDGIDTNIELDYQLSQGGRGLRYSQEPLLMIKNPAMSLSGEIVLGGGNVIKVDEGGDAKHVEIDGNATKAVLEYVKMLRDIILENTHGNRSNPEKMNAAQSGKAMEMLNLPLVWLASKLRISYGEYGLKELVNMVILANQDSELRIGDQIVRKGTLKKDAKVTLKWGDWFESTKEDRSKEADTLDKLTSSGIISKSTALASIAAEYDIIDIEEEERNIEKDRQQALSESKEFQTLMEDK